MVTKSKKQTTVEKEQQRGRIKVGKLKLNEKPEDLTPDEGKEIKGGAEAQELGAPYGGIVHPHLWTQE